MLFAFTMSVDIAMEFYKRVEERNADTEEKRWAILMELADEGKMNGVTATERSKEEYISDLSKNFNVADGVVNATEKIGFVPDDTMDAVWCKDSETGDEVLIDRLTNTVLARRKDGKIMFLGEQDGGVSDETR